eukprot:168239_1
MLGDPVYRHIQRIDNWSVDKTNEQCNDESITTSHKFYNELIALSIDCGILPIFNLNIYHQIHPKVKLLINGYIRQEESNYVYQSTFTFIPNSICQIITVFYSSFRTKQSYLNNSISYCKNEILNNLSKWIKGCKSDHKPTQSLSIDTIHRLLSISVTQKLPNPQIYKKIVCESELITYIPKLIHNTMFDGIYVVTCVVSLEG